MRGLAGPPTRHPANPEEHKSWLKIRKCNDIKVSNFFFHGKGLTKVIYKGREACVAQELGRLLEYTKDGGTLTTMIGGRWKSKFINGRDYEVR